MSAPYDNNRYRATIIRHIDADTTHATIHLGLDVSIDATVRWQGIDAPERYTEAGKVATAWLNDRLPPGYLCEITTLKDRREKFGRYLATFFVNGVNLNQRMIDEGHAVAYEGGPR